MALTLLKQLALDHSRSKYPSLPDYARTTPKYSDKTANGLTKCIIDFLNFSGHQAERIASSGRYIDNRQTYVDVIGRTRVIGSGKWIPGSTTKGTADISSTIRVNLGGREVGLSVKWEVKMKDKQSKDQISYEAKVKSAGGEYFIVHSFEEFYNYYQRVVGINPV